MKRIISVICICVMVLSMFQIAYAGGNKGKPDADVKEEVNALFEQMKQNNEELVKLKEQMSSITVSIQLKISKLSADKTVITQSKATDLKTVISIVKTSKETLKHFKCDGLKQYITSAKIARDNKQFERAMEYINKALEMQEERKETLNAVISDLNTAEQLF